MNPIRRRNVWMLVACISLSTVAPAECSEVPVRWLAGDCAFDGQVNLIDALVLLEHLFRGVDPAPCLPLCDVDGNQRLSLADVTMLLRFLFSEAKLTTPSDEEFCDQIDNDCDNETDEDCVEEPNASVQLCWDPVTEDAGGVLKEVLGYRVHFGTESRDYPHVFDAGNETCFEVTNLVPHVRYFFAVTAYHADSESDYSNEVSASGRSPTDSE